MQTIDKLVSQLHEGDMVQLATKSDKRILAFYEGRCPTSDDDHNFLIKFGWVISPIKNSQMKNR